MNALAAIAAADHVGRRRPSARRTRLREFRGVKRRMEIRGVVGGVTVYDDFAHHPTAIETTLAGLRARAPDARIIAVLEPRSNTMKLGVHREQLAPALARGRSHLVLERARARAGIWPRRSRRLEPRVRLRGQRRCAGAGIGRGSAARAIRCSS